MRSWAAVMGNRGSHVSVMVLGLVLVGASACVREPNIDVDRLVCEDDENCPRGWTCFQRTCVRPEGSSLDATGGGGGADGGGGSITSTGGAQGHDGAVGPVDGPVAGSGGRADAGGTGNVDAAGGSGGSSGGAMGTGGLGVGTGGRVTNGGAVGTGGAIGRGGTVGTGGASGTGGRSGAGGSVGTGGRGGAGGRPGTGGFVGTGGHTGTGGTLGSGGRPGTGGTSGSGGTPGTGGAPPYVGPCDIYAAASTPCVAAYSMVRRLSRTYTGALYQVRKDSSATNTGTGGSTTDIRPLADGYADAASQDAFCGGTVCTVALLYDQSGNNNHLKTGTKGTTAGGASAAEDDYESSATKGAVTAGGHTVYPLYMSVHEGYRTAVGVKGKSVPLGNAAQGIYELADGTRVGTACCWDFGNVPTDPTVIAVMNTLFLGVAYWGKGAGGGPWFMADFEGGVWAGGSNPGDDGWGGLNDAHPPNPNNPSLKVPFAFGVLKTDATKYALRMADVQTASILTTAYEGLLPKAMDNQGGIVLGVGGDNSNNSYGTFYEGAILSGYPSDATDLAVLQNVQAVSYSR